MNTIECIETRKSVRKYATFSIEYNVLIDILKAAVCTPSGKNGQPWKFKIITEKDVILNISNLSIYGSWMKTSAAMIVVFLDNSLTDEIINQIDIVALAKKQFTDRLGKTVSCEMLIKQIISDWIDEHREYLSDMKDEAGTELYDESYLGKPDDTAELQLDGILQEIKNDLYFSKEGILIKKSKIPYIF